MKRFFTFHAALKLGISIVLALVFYLFFLSQGEKTINKILITWDIFSLSYILMSWITFMNTTPFHIRTLAKKEDASSLVIFSVVLLASLASLYAVLILLKNKGDWDINKELETIIYVSAVVLSWFLMHTLFSLRYAHNFYGDHRTNKEMHAGGLEIPGDHDPDYFDFAYFSFVIGMTYQVSDISINSGSLRRLVLLHSILSFGFNTVIIALAVSVILKM